MTQHILNFVDTYIKEEYQKELFKNLVSNEKDLVKLTNISSKLSTLDDEGKEMVAFTFNGLDLQAPQSASQREEQESLLTFLNLYVDLLSVSNKIQRQYLKDEILSKLNSKQQLACISKDGPLLLSAGPGAGKTRTMTYRISTLLNVYGVEPYNILAVTFTNKAAAEMKERVLAIAGNRAKQLNMGTFHSICARFLRSHIQLHDNKFNNKFTIIDDSGQKKILSDVLERLKRDKKEWRDIKSIISSYKNELMLPADLEVAKGNLLYIDVYKEYQNELRKNNLVDFDDLILFTVRILENYKEIREKYQDLYQYIHIDEYQDTNTAQYKLSKLLAEKHTNITVVGDEDQSIYKFRGADITNILNFKNDYDNVKSITLDTNYRSTRTIVEAAQNLIKLNKERLDKVIMPDKNKDDGDLIECVKFYDDKQEATFISKNIRDYIVAEEYKYNDFMVLYRTNSLSRVVEESFIRYGIPYKIVGGTGFYDREEIKDVLAYLQLSINLQDSVAYERIYNTPLRRFSNTILDKVKDFSEKYNMSLFQSTLQLNKINKAHLANQDVSQFKEYILTEPQFKAMNNFLVLIKKIFDVGQKESAYETLKYILSVTEYKKYIRTKYKKDVNKQLEKLSNLDELLTATLDYSENFEIEEDSPLEFMNFISLVRNSGNGNKLKFKGITTLNHHTMQLDKVDENVVFSGKYDENQSAMYDFSIPLNIIKTITTQMKSMFAKNGKELDVEPVVISDILLEIVEDKFILSYRNEYTFELSFKDTQEIINYFTNVSDEQSVKLMSMHSAKGLECPVVFLVGAEQGITPHFFNVDVNLEEERRLFYVGMTRAEQQLYITYCQQRFINGRPNYSSLTQFVKEIPEHFVNMQDTTKK